VPCSAVAAYLVEKLVRDLKKSGSPSSVVRAQRLVSQFEALAREEDVAHRKDLPQPSRFKARESVWPTPQRERGSVDTQQREFLE